MKRQVVLAAGWVLAVVVAVTVGLVAVRTVGDTVRGRGLLGSDAGHPAVPARHVPPSDRVDPAATVVTDGVTDDFGTFVVACQGISATSEDVRPNEADGWRVVSFEPGPDDDVDAVFRSGDSKVEIEVFCNRGRPTVAELEYDRLTTDDD